MESKAKSNPKLDRYEYKHDLGKPFAFIML
jgi:hypothetical protein